MTDSQLFKNLGMPTAAMRRWVRRCASFNLEPEVVAARLKLARACGKIAQLGVWGD